MMMMGNMGGGSMSGGGMGMMNNDMMMNMGGGMNGGMTMGGGMNIPMDPNTMNAMMTNHGGYAAAPGAFGGFNSFLGSLLNFAIDILAVLVVVGLILGAVVFIKRYVFDGLGLGTVRTQPAIPAPDKTAAPSA